MENGTYYYDDLPFARYPYPTPPIIVWEGWFFNFYFFFSFNRLTLARETNFVQNAGGEADIKIHMKIKIGIPDLGTFSVVTSRAQRISYGMKENLLHSVKP